MPVVRLSCIATRSGRSSISATTVILTSRSVPSVQKSQQLAFYSPSCCQKRCFSGITYGYSTRYSKLVHRYQHTHRPSDGDGDNKCSTSTTTTTTSQHRYNSIPCTNTGTHATSEQAAIDIPIPVTAPSSSAEGTLAKKNQKAHMAFPWRSGIGSVRIPVVKRSWISGFLERARKTVFMFMLHERLNFENVSDGAALAFACLVKSIFNHPHLPRVGHGGGTSSSDSHATDSAATTTTITTTKNNHGDSTEEANTNNRGEHGRKADTEKYVASVLPLEDIFESKLASLYHEAIDTTNKCQYTIFHEVGEISAPTLESVDVVLRGKRGMNMENLSYWSVFGFGLIGLRRDLADDVGDDDFDEFVAKPAVKNGISELKKYELISTVRLSYVFQVRERFLVKNSTGETIQGVDDEFVWSTHRILLESTMETIRHNADDTSPLTMGGIGETNFSTEWEDWTIVDIDDWLKGNRFWSIRPRGRKQK
jgi:hypothetical protein